MNADEVREIMIETNAERRAKMRSAVWLAMAKRDRALKAAVERPGFFASLRFFWAERRCRRAINAMANAPGGVECSKVN